MRPSLFISSASGEEETGLNIGRRDSDRCATWHSLPRQEYMDDACEESGNILKGKAQKKTHQRIQEDNLQFSYLLDDNGISCSAF